MRSFDALLERFPGREFEIRRRLRGDSKFQLVGADFCDAFEALKRLEAAGSNAQDRIDEYRGLLAELAEEVSACLDRPFDTFCSVGPDSHGLGVPAAPRHKR